MNHQLGKGLCAPSKRRFANSKKANAHKLRVLKNAQKILNGISICNSYSSDKDKNCLIFENGMPKIVTPSLDWNLTHVKCRWDVTCGVYCRSQTGKHWGYFTNVRSKEEVDSDAMSDMVIAICEQMFEDVAPKLQKLCPFWIATPRSDNGMNDLNLAIKTAHAFKVFNRLGTNFEIDCNKPFVDYHTGKDWTDLAVDFEWKEVELDVSGWYETSSDSM